MPNTVLAAASMPASTSLQLAVVGQGEVFDFIAPHRAAVLTEIVMRLSIQTTQAVCIMPMMNSRTGNATKAYSTSAAPRLSRKNFRMVTESELWLYIARFDPSPMHREFRRELAYTSRSLSR